MPDEAEPVPDRSADRHGEVVSRTVTIPNQRGLHARAAAKFVTLAERIRRITNQKKSISEIKKIKNIKR